MSSLAGRVAAFKFDADPSDLSGMQQLADGETLRRRALSAAILALTLWAGVIVLMLLGNVGLPPLFVFGGIAAAALVGVRASSALRAARQAGSADGTVRLVATGAAFLGVGVSSALLLNAVGTLLARDFVF